MLKVHEDFITMMKTVIKDLFLKYMLNTLKDFTIFIFIYHSYQKELKLINAISLYAICMIKMTMLFT